MDSVVALIREAMRDIERAKATNSMSLSNCNLDCAKIRLEGALSIAERLLKREISDYARTTHRATYGD